MILSLLKINGTTNALSSPGVFHQNQVSIGTIWSVSVQVDQELGQVWYLIVSIPDLCSLTYFQDIDRDTIRLCCLVGLEIREKCMYSLELHMDFLHRGVWAGSFGRHVGLVYSSVCGYKLAI